MVGGASYRNYLLSGKWQPGLSNQFAPYGSGQVYVVPFSTLTWPRGPWGMLKGIIGQRVYVGPELSTPVL
jgi:hypothetical protein